MSEQVTPAVPQKKRNMRRVKRMIKRIIKWIFCLAILCVAALFGYRAHNSFSGVFLAMPSVAAIAANPVANVIHDRVGSYRPAFLGAAVLSVLVFVLYIVVFIVTARERKREEEKAI